MVGCRNKLLYRKVIELRKIGKSYKEIEKELGVSKSTLSDWLSNKRWSKTIQIQLIADNKARSSNYLKRINRLRHLKTLEKYESYRQTARAEYLNLKLNRLFLAGLAIYWGEGEKTDRGRVSLVNSDEKMLKVMVNFYRNVLKIPESKLRAALFIYDDINADRALEFWARSLKLSKTQFIKTQVLPSRSSLTKHKIVYGMCNIYFSSVETSVKMKEWMLLLANEMRV